MSLSVAIRKSFSGFRLDINFEAENESLALLGASGCGKSMTLKCIAGIETPDEGRIVLDGITLFDSEKRINLSPQKRGVGFLFQNSALFPNMTIEQNILCGMRGKAKEAKAGELVESIRRFHLDGLAKRYPHQLSGGQQQRAALARVLVSKPKILMLDEPFSALDSYLRWTLEQELTSVFKSFPGTTLFVSHNRDEVYRLCDRIAVVADGRIDQIGDKWKLFYHPQTYAAGLLTGCKNISPVKISGSYVYSEQWGIKLNTGKAVESQVRFAGIRARSIEPCTSQEENAFRFEIVSRMMDTYNCILMIRPHGKDIKHPICWEMERHRYKQMKNKEDRYARIRPEKILLLTE